MAAENSDLHHKNKLNAKILYIQIENIYFKL